jgi:GxxExxY protein
MGYEFQVPCRGLSRPQRTQRVKIVADKLTEEIIAADIEVHRILGPGLLESIYEEALCHELSLRNMPFERQKEVDVIYKSRVIKGQRLDLLVNSEVVVEIKSVRRLEDIFTAQVLSYLRSTGLNGACLSTLVKVS